MKEKYPKIICNEKELIKGLSKWNNGGNYKKEFGKVLLKLGFNESDIITLYNYNKQTNSFSYIINDKNIRNENSIWLKKNGGITLTIGTKNSKKLISYRDISIDKNINYMISAFQKEYLNGDLYRRFYNLTKAEINIEKEDYSIELIVKSPENFYLNDIENMSYRLKNENQLINYLWNLQLPIEITEVYKKLLSISLKDICQYPLFSLKISKYNKKEQLEEITDMIEVQNGKLTTFIITKNGKTIKLNNDYEWEYITSYDNISISLNSNKNTYTYKLVSDKKNNSDIALSQIKTDANKEISNTKRLIRNIFNK